MTNPKVGAAANVLLDAVSLAISSENTPQAAAENHKMIRLAAQRLSEIDAFTIDYVDDQGALVDIAPLLKATCAVILSIIGQAGDDLTNADRLAAVSAARELISSIYPTSGNVVHAAVDPRAQLEAAGRELAYADQHRRDALDEVASAVKNAAGEIKSVEMARILGVSHLTVLRLLGNA